METEPGDSVVPPVRGSPRQEPHRLHHRRTRRMGFANQPRMIGKPVKVKCIVSQSNTDSRALYRTDSYTNFQNQVSDVLTCVRSNAGGEQRRVHQDPGNNGREVAAAHEATRADGVCSPRDILPL